MSWNFFYPIDYQNNRFTQIFVSCSPNGKAWGSLKWSFVFMLWKLTIDKFGSTFANMFWECWESRPTCVAAPKCPASRVRLPLRLNSFWSRVQQSVDSLLFKFYVSVCDCLLSSDLCLRLHSIELCQWKLPPLRLD